MWINPAYKFSNLSQVYILSSSTNLSIDIDFSTS
uniref:Uncharacterized protein n=1 Tax=Solanum lycopersicum TaxID=4081 RepID=K4BGB1_SOLLC